MGDFVKWGKVRALMYQSIQKPNHVAHLNPPLPPPHAQMYPFASYRRFAPQRKNNSVAPSTSIPQASTGDAAGGGDSNDSALNTANNSEISDDSDADSDEGKARSANRVNEMFDSLEEGEN